jgi:transposase
LVPNTHDSGESKKTKGNTERSNHYLRTALVESSWSVVRKDPALLMKYKACCRQVEKKQSHHKDSKTFIMKNKLCFEK